MISTIFEANYRNLSLASSPNTFSSEALTWALEQDEKERRVGVVSKSWWKIVGTLGRHTGDPRWMTALMPQFDEAFEKAFVSEGAIMHGFMTSAKAYTQAFNVYMDSVSAAIRVRIGEDELGVEYLAVPSRLEWCLRNWPYGGGLPIPIITNRFLGWIENLLATVKDATEEVSIVVFVPHRHRDDTVPFLRVHTVLD